MEDIEYLEEYAEMVLPAMQQPTTTTHNTTMASDDDSSSIDQDIFESIFDDRSSDDENSIAGVENEKILMQKPQAGGLPINLLAKNLTTPAENKTLLTEIKPKIVMQKKADVLKADNMEKEKIKIQTQTAKNDHYAKTIATVRPTFKNAPKLIKEKTTTSTLTTTTTSGNKRPVVISKANRNVSPMKTTSKPLPTSTAITLNTSNNKSSTSATATPPSQATKKVVPMSVTKSPKLLADNKTRKDALDTDSYESDLSDSFSFLTDDTDDVDEFGDMNNFNSDLSEEEVLRFNNSKPTKLSKKLNEPTNKTFAKQPAATSLKTTNNRNNVALKNTTQNKPKIEIKKLIPEVTQASLLSNEESIERHLEQLFDDEIDPQIPSKAKEEKRIVAEKLPEKSKLKVQDKPENQKISDDLKKPQKTMQTKETAKKVLDKKEPAKKIVIGKKKVAGKIIIDGKASQPMKDNERNEISKSSKSNDEQKRKMVLEQNRQKKLTIFEDLKSRLQEFKKKNENSPNNDKKIKENAEINVDKMNVETSDKIVMKSKQNMEVDAKHISPKQNMEVAAKNISPKQNMEVAAKNISPIKSKTVIDASKQNNILEQAASIENVDKNQQLDTEYETSIISFTPEMSESAHLDKEYETSIISFTPDKSKTAQLDKEYETSIISFTPDKSKTAQLDKDYETSIISFTPDKLNTDPTRQMAQSMCDRIDDIEKRIKEIDTEKTVITESENNETPIKSTGPKKAAETKQRKRKQVLDVIDSAETLLDNNKAEKVNETGKRKIEGSTISAKRRKPTKATAIESNAEIQDISENSQLINFHSKPNKKDLHKNVLLKRAQIFESITETAATEAEKIVLPEEQLEQLGVPELQVEKRQSPRLGTTNGAETTSVKSPIKRVNKKKAQIEVQVRKDECKLGLYEPAITPKSSTNKKNTKQKKGQQTKAILKAKEKYPGNWFDCSVRINSNFVQKYLQNELPTKPTGTGKRVTFSLQETVNISPTKTVSPEKTAITPNHHPKENLTGRAQVFTIPPQHRRAPEEKINTSNNSTENSELISSPVEEPTAPPATVVNEKTSQAPMPTTTTTTTPIPTKNSTNPVILVGKPELSENLKNAEKSMYTFCRPPPLAKHDNILLDECCPLVDPNTPGVCNIPKITQSPYQIVDLPAFITMRTKIITRKDISQKRGEIPNAVKNRVEQLTAQVQQVQQVQQKDNMVMQERMFVRQGLMCMDKILTKDLALLNTATVIERQRAIEEITQTQNYKPTDVAMTKAIIQKYLTTLSKVCGEDNANNSSNLSAENTKFQANIVKPIRFKPGAPRKVVRINNNTTRALEMPTTTNSRGRKSLPVANRAKLAVQQQRAKKPVSANRRRATIATHPIRMPELSTQLEKKSIIVTRKTNINFPSGSSPNVNKEVLVVNEALGDEDEAMDAEVILPDIIRDGNMSIVKDETIEDDFIG